MDPDFDKVLGRSPNYSFKWRRYHGRDIVPCWVADSEFATPAPVRQALTDLSQHGALGYLYPDQYEQGAQAVIDWLQYRHGFKIPPEWIVWTPGVVPAFNITCRALTEPGQALVVQTPNYPPILSAHQNHQLQGLQVGLVGAEQQLDFERLEQHLGRDDCRAMILCNPMNPNGKVIAKADLQRLGQMCEANGVVLISDEIHSDLILEPGLVHTPAFGLDELRDNSITLMSAGKTFNIAGLGVSFAIIPNAGLRKRYKAAANGVSPWANMLGLVATATAFNDGRDWYRRQLNYLRANRDYLIAALNQIGGLKAASPEATYLAWIDCSGLGQEDVQTWFERRGVGPSPGRDFGAPQFARINFACPRRQLETIVARCSN